MERIAGGEYFKCLGPQTAKARRTNFSLWSADESNGFFSFTNSLYDAGKLLNQKRDMRLFTSINGKT